MSNLGEMNIDELCRYAHEQQVEIEVRIEPDGCKTITVQPWEKYEMTCPYNKPV